MPSAEVWIHPEVKDAFLGYPVRSLKDDVEFWLRAGYDFVALEADLYSAPQLQAHIFTPLANTADLYAGHRPERSWVTGGDTLSTWEQVRSFPWPKAADVDLGHLARIRQHLPSDMKVLVNVGHVFTAAWQLMGFETFCLALHEDPSLVTEVVDRLGEESLLLTERALGYDSVGVVCFQDDIAYTSGLVISPRMLRQVFFPWLRRAAACCHEAGRPMLYHSDGKLDEALPEIVDCGVDGIQAIEPKCMDIAAVKRDWGDKLALMGNVDLGYTLTRGTAREVREEVRQIIRHAGPGGGLLVGSANSIPNYVPLENYKALLVAVEAYGRYPIAVEEGE